MFAGLGVLVLVILLMTRRIADAPVEERPQLDVVGAVLSALGLGALVFGVLRSAEWGWIQPTVDGPSWAGLSPTIWLVLAGLFVALAVPSARLADWATRRAATRQGAL